MTQYKNYTAQAIKSLNQLTKPFEKYAGRKLKPDTPTHFVDRVHDNTNFEILQKLLIDSVKFVLPKGGKLLDTGLKGLKGEKLRLPYPITVLEFDEDPDMPFTGEVPSPKRIALAVEGKTREFSKLFGNFNNGDWAFSHIPEDEDVIYVQAISYMDDIKNWAPVIGGILVPMDWEADSDSVVINLRDDMTADTPRAKGWPIVLVPTIFKEVAEREGETQAIDYIYQDTVGEIFALLEFLEALSCSNIVVEKTTQLKASVNAKRMKKGKLPLYDYHCLTVATTKGTTSSKASGGTLEVERNSPRQHLRRGHIRRLQSGHKIWINSCVVGKHGKIDKDYVIT